MNLPALRALLAKAREAEDAIREETRAYYAKHGIPFEPQSQPYTRDDFTEPATGFLPETADLIAAVLNDAEALIECATLLDEARVALGFPRWEGDDLLPRIKAALSRLGG